VQVGRPIGATRPTAPAVHIGSPLTAKPPLIGAPSRQNPPAIAHRDRLLARPIGVSVARPAPGGD